MEKKPTKICFVSGLDYTVTEQELRDFFKDVAEIVECDIKRREDGKCKGFAFISFSTPELAQKAAEAKNESRFKNHFIDVELNNTARNNLNEKPLIIDINSEDVPTSFSKTEEKDNERHSRSRRHHHHHHHHRHRPHHHRHHHHYSSSYSESSKHYSPSDSQKD